MKECLVTGGCGFIGSHLVEGLLARGHSGARPGRSEHRLRSEPVPALGTGKLKILRGSITVAADVRQALDGCDTVFHLAALPSVTKSVEDPLLCHDICATGTLRVLDEARRARIRRVVYAGSSSAYGDQPGLLRTEDDPLFCRSPYAGRQAGG